MADFQQILGANEQIFQIFGKQNADFWAKKYGNTARFSCLDDVDEVVAELHKPTSTVLVAYKKHSSSGHGHYTLL